MKDVQEDKEHFQHTTAVVGKRQADVLSTLREVGVSSITACKGVNEHVFVRACVFCPCWHAQHAETGGCHKLHCLMI